MAERFTKADAAALWHAVQAFDLQVREMAKMKPPFALPVLEQEQQRVAAAKRALRKVQAMRRAASGVLAPAAVAWEYANQHRAKFLTHSDPAKWHPHDRDGFKDFRPLAYADGVPASERRDVCASPCMEGMRAQDDTWTGPCSCYPNAGVPASQWPQAVAWRYPIGGGRYAATTDEADARRASTDGTVDALAVIPSGVDLPDGAQR